MKKILSSGLIFLGCLTFATGCGQKSNSLNVMSFDEFSLDNQIEIEDNCGSICRGYKMELKYLKYVAEQMYPYLEEKQNNEGLSLEKNLQKMHSRINNTTTAKDYYLILLEWAAAFHDGHVNANVDDVEKEKLDFYEPKIKFEILAPGTLHEKLLISSFGNAEGELRVGTEIQFINGRPWTDYLNQAIKLYSGSTERMRRRGAAKMLPLVLGLESESSKIVIDGQFNGNKVQGTILRPPPLPAGSSETGPNPSARPEDLNNLIKSSVTNNRGYLRIDGFQGGFSETQLDEAMKSFVNTEGLLIDVRNNGGGTQSGDVILSYLAKRKIYRYVQQVRNSDFIHALRPDYILKTDFIDGQLWSQFWGDEIEPKKQLYTKPVVVLTSSRCFSACDTFVSAIKQYQFGTIVGESTGGGTGSPQSFTLPYSKMRFRYSMVKGLTGVTQEPIEGVGTAVDIEIYPTVEERQLNVDLQLKKTWGVLDQAIEVAKSVNPEKSNVAVVGTMSSSPKDVSGVKYFKVNIEKLNGNTDFDSIVFDDSSGLEIQNNKEAANQSVISELQKEIDFSDNEGE